MNSRYGSYGSNEMSVPETVRPTTTTTTTIITTTTIVTTTSPPVVATMTSTTAMASTVADAFTVFSTSTRLPLVTAPNVGRSDHEG